MGMLVGLLCAFYLGLIASHKLYLWCQEQKEKEIDDLKAEIEHLRNEK